MIYKILFVTAWLLATVCATAQAQEAPTLGTFDPNPRYRLNPGDVLEVQYRYTPEFNQAGETAVTIQPDGFVSLKLVGDLKVGGLTLEQAQTAVHDKATTRLKDPEVVIILKEFQKPYFVVAGEVLKPGKIEMREKITALGAVMLAGGFKESARSSQVVVFRKLNSEMAEVKVLDLNKVKRTSDLEKDFMLESGDMLLIPENRITKISRFMRLANVGLYLNPADILR